MSLTVPAAAARLGRNVVEAEAAVADALVKITALAHSAALAEAQIGGASAATTHQALKAIHASLGGLIDVRANVQRSHGALRDIGREMMTTAEPTCPPSAELISVVDQVA